MNEIAGLPRLTWLQFVVGETQETQEHWYCGAHPGLRSWGRERACVLGGRQRTASLQLGGPG